MSKRIVRNRNMIFDDIGNLGDLDNVVGFFSEVYTCFLFISSFVCFLCLCFSRVVVQFVRDGWINFLQKRFPDLEFVRENSIRIAAETHRNVGIVTVLLTIRGRCDFEGIKKRLKEELLEKKLNNGQYRYRHLRMVLTSRWGKFAWQKIDPFCLDNHVCMGSAFYRGRPLNDSNIQDYVSDFVSKYLIPDLPPWQIIVVPVSIERYYILLRVHHMLLSDTTGVNLSHFFHLTSDKPEDKVQYREKLQLRRSNPFRDLYKVPKELPNLIDQISDTLSNAWNEFLALYDPLENPAALKNPNLKLLVAVFVIASVATAKKFSLSYNEYRIRHVDLTLIVLSLWNTVNPIKIMLRVIYILYRFAVFGIFKLPLMVIWECWSMWMIYDEKYSDWSLVKAALSAWRSLQGSIKEATYLWRLCYNGPRALLDELNLAKIRHKDYLQTSAICGRKVVSWSNPVPLELIQEIEEATGATTSEIALTAVAASLREFFIQQGRLAPERVNAIARGVSLDDFFGRSKGQGVLCLCLHTQSPWDDEDGPIAQLHTMQQVLLRSRLRQPAIFLATLLESNHGLLTKALPSFIMRIILNWLSRRFNVLITEVPAFRADYKRKYLSGQEVENIIYWTAPQANICISLTLLTYGDTMHLAVMTDSMLHPHHTVLSGAFSQQIRKLAIAAGVRITENIPRSRLMSNDTEESNGRLTPHKSSSLSSSDDDYRFEDLEDNMMLSEEDNNVNVL